MGSLSGGLLPLPGGSLVLRVLAGESMCWQLSRAGGRIRTCGLPGRRRVTRRPPLADGETARTACARVLVRGGVDERTGEVLPAAVLAERVGWCAGLVQGMAAGLLAAHWNRADVDAPRRRNGPGRAAAAGGGVDGAAPHGLGRRRPGRDHCQRPDRAHGPGAGGEGPALGVLAGRADRRRAGSVARAAAQADARGVGRGTRRVARRGAPAVQRDQCPHPPGSPLSRRPGAAAAGRVRPGGAACGGADAAAAGCDRQQAAIERSVADPRRVLLRLQLPVRLDPRGYRDWTWVSLPLALPPAVPAGAALHLPTLRIGGGKVRADLAFTHAVPAARRAGHEVALGVDWGLNTLLSAGAARLHGDATITVLGAGAQYRAAGVLAKQHRLRRHGERLHSQGQPVRQAHRWRRPAPAERQGRRPGGGDPPGQRAPLQPQRRLARSAARWAVDQAIAAGATVIYLEDLRSMEARGMGRTLSTRLSQAVRGQIADWIRHLAAEAGIAVVTVPARGTSRCCPRCLAPLRHPKTAEAGWKWAVCPSPECGWQGGRDQGAWQRIAARGLAHQDTTVAGRAAGATAIRAVDDNREATAVITPEHSGRDRSKTGPTRKRAPRPAPRRRGAPSPARPPGRPGQRPEGHATEGRHLPHAARRNQDVRTTSPPPTRRHQPRGAALGAGFHLHAHATPPRPAPPRWETIPGP